MDYLAEYHRLEEMYAIIRKSVVLFRFTHDRMVFQGMIRLNTQQFVDDCAVVLKRAATELLRDLYEEPCVQVTSSINDRKLSFTLTDTIGGIDLYDMINLPLDDAAAVLLLRWRRGV